MPEQDEFSFDNQSTVDANARRPAAPLPVAPLDDRQRLACLRLIRSENVGPVTFRELVNHYGGAEPALDALPELLRRTSRGRRVRICPRDVAEAELDAARRIGATPLFTIEPGYPAGLAHLAVPPPMIYVKGRTALLARPMVGIVGARNGSAAGMKLTRMFARALGEAGFVVVSGLARGIDGAAHEASIDSGTVAVLAGGIDFEYPPEHVDLQQRIGRGGCLVTEQAPGFQPRGQDFPRRNRIISGMSLAVLVVEAAKRSGSLITARMANEQGRLVLAVPGHPLDPRAEGTNGLIKQGATLAATVEDVLEAITPLINAAPAVSVREPPSSAIRGPRTADRTASENAGLDQGADEIEPASPPHLLSPALSAPFPDASALILSALGPAPVSIDELARATALPMRSLRAALLELDLAGAIEQHGHQLVSLKATVS
jgi:DNA processing protein